MGMTEILLIALGIIIFIISFLVPESLGKDKAKEVKIPEEKIQALIQKEIKKAEYQIEEKTEETITAATEKAERYMERISNEKIMAVQEYSDTVLGQINRNHEEAVFLYDMLNNKHIQLKNTAAEINHKVEDVKAELETTKIEQVLEVTEEEIKKVVTEDVEEQKAMVSDLEIIDLDLENENETETGNNKEMILKLHTEGKSKIDIAKTLGLGIGEVKLVIDLFESNEV